MGIMIQIPVETLDEKCLNCKAMELEKTEFYADMETVMTLYQCKNLHLCQYIRNRIVRNENNKEEQKDG